MKTIDQKAEYVYSKGFIETVPASDMEESLTHSSFGLNSPQKILTNLGSLN